MWPPATDGLAYPAPSPLAFHASGGPSFGPGWSSPVSSETLPRRGPRHWGQGPTAGGALSAAAGARDAASSPATAQAHRARRGTDEVRRGVGWGISGSDV